MLDGNPTPPPPGDHAPQVISPAEAYSALPPSGEGVGDKTQGQKFVEHMRFAIGRAVVREDAPLNPDQVAWLLDMVVAARDAYDGSDHAEDLEYRMTAWSECFDDADIPYDRPDDADGPDAGVDISIMCPNCTMLNMVPSGVSVPGRSYYDFKDMPDDVALAADGTKWVCKECDRTHRLKSVVHTDIEPG